MMALAVCSFAVLGGIFYLGLQAKLSILVVLLSFLAAIVAFLSIYTFKITKESIPDEIITALLKNPHGDEMLTRTVQTILENNNGMNRKNFLLLFNAIRNYGKLKTASNKFRAAQSEEQLHRIFKRFLAR